MLLLVLKSSNTVSDILAGAKLGRAQNAERSWATEKTLSKM
jgi:hypothetical protein